jgi:hypothetical protein
VNKFFRELGIPSVGARSQVFAIFYAFEKEEYLETYPQTLI